MAARLVPPWECARYDAMTPFFPVLGVPRSGNAMKWEAVDFMIVRAGGGEFSVRSVKWRPGWRGHAKQVSKEVWASLVRGVMQNIFKTSLTRPQCLEQNYQ